jgi:hypothetical protein
MAMAQKIGGNNNFCRDILIYLSLDTAMICDTGYPERR